MYNIVLVSGVQHRDLVIYIRSDQISRSVTKLCPTLCDPMDCSTPGFPVPHHLLEFAQVHIHCIGDDVQASHPLTPLHLLPSIFPSIGDFSNELSIHV